MRAELVRHEKFLIRQRFLVEIKVHAVPLSEKYPDGLRWGLICIDQMKKSKILMDNHHPKGPHMHLDDQELNYEFRDLDKLIEGFRRLIRERMGVSI